MGDVPRQSGADPITDAILRELRAAGPAGVPRSVLDTAARASAATVRRYLAQLTAAGAVEVSGTGRGTRYRLPPEPAPTPAPPAGGTVLQNGPAVPDLPSAPPTGTAPTLPPPGDAGPMLGGLPGQGWVRHRPAGTDADAPPRPAAGPDVPHIVYSPGRDRRTAPRVIIPGQEPGDGSPAAPATPGDDVRTGPPGTPRRTIAILAGLAVALVVVDGLLVWSWQALGSIATISIGAALVGGASAYLRKRGDRLLTILTVYAQVVLGIGLAVGVVAWLRGWGGVVETFFDCPSGTCVSTTGDATHAAGYGLAGALLAFAVSGPPAWYWFTRDRSPDARNGRRRTQTVIASVVALVLAGASVSLTVWDANSATTKKTAGKYAIPAEQQLVIDYVELISGNNYGKDKGGYIRALNQLDPHDRTKFPPALATLTCSNSVVRQRILKTLWTYRDGELEMRKRGAYWKDWQYTFTALPHLAKIDGDHATVDSEITISLSPSDSVSTWRFSLVKEWRADSHGWHVCGMTQRTKWHQE